MTTPVPPVPTPAPIYVPCETVRCPHPATVLVGNTPFCEECAPIVVRDHPTLPVHRYHPAQTKAT